MISRDELAKIGHFNKTHGIKGELSFSFTDDSFDGDECPFLICELAGIFVPFTIEECRFKSDSAAFVKLKGIDSDLQGKEFVSLDVYFPKKHMNERQPDDEVAWDYFIGYDLMDEATGVTGKITDVDDSTVNTLLIVDCAGEELLIPAAEGIILGIDEQKKICYVELPEGLVDLNK